MATPSQTPVAVITGASSGIGKEAAKLLAAQGWTVIGLGRDPERCEQATSEIRGAASEGSQVTLIRADLSLMANTEHACEQILALTDRVNVLLNNAGGIARDIRLTPEGNEATFAGNHLGHFLLTQRLLPLLRGAAATAPAGSVRIVNVSSAAHLMCQGLDWDDLQMIDNFHASGAYCRVKFANVLFTRELARRLAGEGIVAHAMHPGIVDSNFIQHGDEMLQSSLLAKKDQWISPRTAAEDLVWVATAQEAGEMNGEYFHNRAPAPVNPAALDADAAARLWQESEALLAK